MYTVMLRQLLVMALMPVVNTICYRHLVNNSELWVVQCPVGKVLVPLVYRSDYASNTQFLRKLYTGFVGKQTYEFNESNIWSMLPMDFLKGFQCVPVRQLYKRCEDLSTYNNDETCGYIIGCLDHDPQPSQWGFTLQPIPRHVILAYTYMVVGEMSWHNGYYSDQLYSGSWLALSNKNAVLQNDNEKPTFVLGYEVFAQNESSTLHLSDRKHGDCWKRHYPDTEMYQDTPLHTCTDGRPAPPVVTRAPPAIRPRIFTTGISPSFTTSSTQSTTETGQAGSPPPINNVLVLYIGVPVLVIVCIVLVIILRCCCIKKCQKQNKTSSTESNTTMNNTQELDAYSGPASSLSTEATYYNVEDDAEIYAEQYDASTRQAVNNGNIIPQPDVHGFTNPNNQHSYLALIQ